MTPGREGRPAVMQAKVVMNRCFDLLSSVFGRSQHHDVLMKRVFPAQFLTEHNEKADPKVGLEARGA